MLTNTVFRQKGNHLIQLSGSDTYQRCDSLVSHSGESQWLEDVKLTEKGFVKSSV